MKDNNESKIEGQENIKMHALQHFSELYSNSEETYHIAKVALLSVIHSKIFDDENGKLLRPILEHEIREAI